MRNLALALVALTLVACSGERLTGVAAQNAVRDHEGNAAPAGREPMIILNGKEITIANFRELDALTIESVQVIKGATGVQKYGVRASHGVILIASKPTR